MHCKSSLSKVEQLWWLFRSATAEAKACPWLQSAQPAWVGWRQLNPSYFSMLSSFTDDPVHGFCQYDRLDGCPFVGEPFFLHLLLAVLVGD